MRCSQLQKVACDSNVDYGVCWKISWGKDYVFGMLNRDLVILLFLALFPVLRNFCT